MEYLNNNIPEALLILGLVILTIEIAVLGFATFFLFFLGIALILTAGLLFIDVLPETLLAILSSVSGFTAFFGLLLWKPLKRMQDTQQHKKAENDMYGHEFVVPDDVMPNQPVNEMPIYKYSGISWRLISEVAITKGDKVRIVDVNVGTLKVAPITSKSFE